ncbi:MAG: hypothetical protein ABSB22_17535 [Thermodesulfobacteriota bacterium]|jgi:hypothetical protein
MYGKRCGNLIGIFLLIVTGGLFAGPGYSEDIKIGSVDMQKAANECNARKEASVIPKLCENHVDRSISY